MAKKKKANLTQVISPFATNICVNEWNNVGIKRFNEKLSRELYQMRSRDPEGIFRSNMSGTWHSKDTVFSECGDLGQKLKRMFGQAFIKLAESYAHRKGGSYEFKMQAWCMMYRDRGYASVHTHPNCHLSGVYYVDAGAPQEAQQLATNVAVVPGSLEFVDTRGGVGSQQVAGLALNPAFRAAPVTGRMITFPCWLPHWVHPVIGQHERIAVACNATITKYTPPKG